MASSVTSRPFYHRRRAAQSDTARDRAAVSPPRVSESSAGLPVGDGERSSLHGTTARPALAVGISMTATEPALEGRRRVSRMRDKIGVAIIGATGLAGSGHLAGYEAVPGAAVRVLWDRNIERARALAQEHGVPSA